MGAILPNLRLILTGKGMGPSIFEIALLGKEEVMKRFNEKSIFFQNIFIKKQMNLIKVYGIRTYSFHGCLRRRN